MNNPFAYSNYVTGESFCNRKMELSEQQVFNKIKTKKLNVGAMHVELYGTISEKDFITRTFQSLNQLESNYERLLKSVSKTINNFKINLSIDPTTGDTSVSPSFEAVNEKVVLEELMNLLTKYSQKRKLVIAFDEFQEVASYTEDGFEKRLRSSIQQHSNICYIFSGSQQHLITEMFNSSNRAFYKLADSFPLDKIETKHYIPWIQNLFRKHYIPWIQNLFRRNNVHLPVKLIEEIISRFENHPMYIQNFLFHLWEEPVKKELSPNIIDKIENSIIVRKNLEYTVLWESLTINQKKTLKLILLNNGSNLFNADSLKSVNLKTASLVTKALSSLTNKEIIAKNANYQIQDIVFKKWLQKTLSL